MANIPNLSPPPERLGLGSMGVAFLAHSLLIAALTWGTQWRNQTTLTTASAELWAALPSESAAESASASLPAEPESPKAIAQTPEPAITTEPEKRKAKAIEKKQPPKKQPSASKQEALLERQREQARQDQLNRLTGLAAASSGAALQNSAPSGPSASYAGRVVAKIRPNIIFNGADSLQGNPAAEVDIRIAPDGTILQPIKLTKSSGHKAWDAAVLRALEKTDTLPRDIDGRIPNSMTLILRPQP